MAIGAMGDSHTELQNKANAARVAYGHARGLALAHEKVMQPKGAKQTEEAFEAEYRKRLKLAVDPLADQKAEADKSIAEADAASRK